MPYLGNEPAVAYTSTTKDSFSGDGSTTAFTMSKSANVNAVRVVVEVLAQLMWMWSMWLMAWNLVFVLLHW